MCYNKEVSMTSFIIGGGLSLSIGLLEPPFWGFLTSIFLWGMGGGVAMSMSRTIMQENAPDDMRARVLAVFTLSNTGGMPIGALALGYFTEFFGILSALAFVILGVWISSALLWRFSNLSRIGSWRRRSCTRETGTRRVLSPSGRLSPIITINQFGHRPSADRAMMTHRLA